MNTSINEHIITPSGREKGGRKSRATQKESPGSYKKIIPSYRAVISAKAWFCSGGDGNPEKEKTNHEQS